MPKFTLPTQAEAKHNLMIYFLSISSNICFKETVLLSTQGSHRLEKYLNLGAFLKRP